MKLTRSEVIGVVALMTLSGAVGLVAGANTGMPAFLSKSAPPPLVRSSGLPAGCSSQIDLDSVEADDEFRRAVHAHSSR